MTDMLVANTASFRVNPVRRKARDLPDPIASATPSYDPSASGVIDLDAPRLQKLAEQLRGKGHVAVAFPEEVRIFIERDSKGQPVQSFSVKAYSRALEFLEGKTLSTKSMSL